jgi:ATP-dependent Lhr-like helicase
MDGVPTAFDQLAPPLQRWLWEQGWTGLRDAQAAALPLILEGQRDVVIAAATASGKTEAAFLPLLTRLHASDTPGVVLYIAPVKALINDQSERIGLMCERLELPVTPWHGDVGETARRRFLAKPQGVVLITPESLESLLFRRGADMATIFAALTAVVVDELHAFIGGERGRQLQSLLHRLEEALGRRVPRIGLSATLGDMRLAADFLRPGKGAEVALIVGAVEGKSLQLTCKAIVRSAADGEIDGVAHGTIAAEMFDRLRDANYLIFPNTTGMVEFYADALRRRCETAGVPVSFFPHHGRLGKTERETTERSLKQGDQPVSAICTTTLEMGINIGAIRGVVQIGAPASVASLCQRIGRAGRRAGDAAVLWQYCVVDESQTEAIGTQGLQAEFIQALAIIRLFLARWYEPPPAGALHYSTLVQQVLALIGERHGVSAAAAYRTLCLHGPFAAVSEADFIELLRSLAKHGLIMQDATGLLLHGPVGEKRVNHFTFFAAFPDTLEYRLLHAGKELGTLPLSSSLRTDSVLIFAGRRWRVASIDHDKRRIDLAPASSGQLPRTGGAATPVHDRVRQEMRAVLAGNEPLPWLDPVATKVLQAARQQYAAMGLATQAAVKAGAAVHLFLWRGDRVQNALAALLQRRNLRAENHGICLTIERTTLSLVAQALQEVASSPAPDPAELLDRPELQRTEKWDWVLPDRLFFANYVAARFDLAGAVEACQKSALAGRR